MLQKVSYFIVILFSMLSASLKTLAQDTGDKNVFYNDGAVLALQENSVLYVGTDYIQQSGDIQNRGIIALAANWTNNSIKEVFKDNVGTVKLVGADQVLGGYLPTQFNDLILAKAGVKTLENNQDVVGVLDLGASELATADYVMHLKNPSKGNLLRSTGFVSSSKQGGFRRNTSLSTEYLFPLGFKNDNRTYYRPVVVKPNTPTDNSYTAAVYPDIYTIENFNSSQSFTSVNSDWEEINRNYYFKLNREKGEDPITLDVYYESTIDGNYNTLLYWKKQDLKLEQITTVAEAQRFSGESFTDKLSTRRWNDFNNEYYLIARTPLKTSEDTFNMQVPNVISANNDGKNDRWLIPSFNGFVENEVFVYNRWGTEVYRKTNYSNQDAWAAENIIPGTYFYRIIINPKSANPEVKHGYLTIIK